LETEGQALITQPDEVIVVKELKDSDEDFGFKNYDISFEEQYLSSEESNNKLDNSQFTYINGDEDFITQEKVKTWEAISSERSRLVKSRTNNKANPSHHRFAYRGV
jgi:hypothetical protein